MVIVVVTTQAISVGHLLRFVVLMRHYIYLLYYFMSLTVNPDISFCAKDTGFHMNFSHLHFLHFGISFYTFILYL
jgi:hypothetical protein